MSHAHRTRTAVRELRREVPATVGLLADERDFEAMRRYRTFAFDDHETYLHRVDALLASLADEGLHTSVALFDPEEFAEFCAERGLDPDTPTSRAYFTAGIAGSGGACVPALGRSADALVPVLVDAEARRATWEYAATVLDGLGTCGDCGRDVGDAAFDRACDVLLRLLECAGPGGHHLVCSVPAEGEHLLVALHARRPAAEGPALLDSEEGIEFATVLALGIALGEGGGLVLRTFAPGGRDRVHGWRLGDGGLVPLTAAEVFDAYCRDVETGDIVAPESDVDHRAGFALGPDCAGPFH
jgi:hypothetical protein